MPQRRRAAPATRATGSNRAAPGRGRPGARARACSPPRSTRAPRPAATSTWRERRLRRGAAAIALRAPARSRRTSACRARSARWRIRASTAGGRREEHDPLGVLRDLGEVAHHGRLVARAVGGRDRRPHPEVELAAKLLDQTLLVLSDRGIALG